MSTVVTLEALQIWRVKYAIIIDTDTDILSITVQDLFVRVFIFEVDVGHVEYVLK
jgi:hypothetical protein